MPEFSRWCAEHRLECTERGDEVLCPKGHALQEHEWTQGPASAGVVAARRRDSQLQMVTSAAEHAVRVAGADVDRAAAHLVARARRSPEVLAALLDVGARWAVQRTLQALAGPSVERVPFFPESDRPVMLPAPTRTHEGAHHRGPQGEPKHQPVRGLQLLAESNLQHLMRWRLPQGGVLGEASHADVLAAAAQLGGVARGAAIRSRWLRLLAVRMPIKARVRSFFSERDLGVLYGQAEREMGQLADRVQAQLEARESALAIATTAPGRIEGAR